MDTFITYSDFLTKIINVRREIKESDVHKAFEQLDVDKSGKIDHKDLNSLLQRRGHDHLKASTLLDEVETSKMLLSGSAEDSDLIGERANTRRNDISYGTFKQYILGDGEVSDYSDMTWRSSMALPNQEGRLDDADSMRASMASQLGSIKLDVDYNELEEKKFNVYS